MRIPPRLIAGPLLLVGCSSPALLAQANRDDLTPLEIEYTTQVGDDLQTLKIELEIRHLKRPFLHVAMPNWTPGAYGIGRYGEKVQDLAARGADGAPLQVTRLDHQTWSIATGHQRALVVTYTMPVRRRRFARRTTPNARITGFQISGPSTYLYVCGAKRVPVTARYEIPEGWDLANGLLKGVDPLVRRARDYDTFIDAPTQVGIFRRESFTVAGTPFQCVFFANNQEYDFDIPAFVEVCRKIVTCQGRLFGSFPFPNYVFLFSLPGGGGLEHLNSTSIGLSPRGMKRDVRSGASVTAHEFFHVWNVKRIRPKVLGPFEYEHENYTGNLWVSEGWTSYYGDLTLVRTGLTSREQFLRGLQGIVQRELNKEDRKVHSVYWASRNVWHRDREAPPRVDYYGTGQMLAALIDLKIRHESANRKSLDDVMRFLNRWFAERDQGFAEGDIERACTAISNYDFHEFFARYVTGTLDPPLAEYLAYAGIAYEEEVTTVAFPFRLRRFGGNLRIFGRRGEGPAEDQAPRPGDTVLTMDGETVEDPDAFLARHAPGDKIALKLRRGGKILDAEIALIANRRMTPKISPMEKTNPLQRAIQESWLGGK